jgi:hypothetical protein
MFLVLSDTTVSRLLLRSTFDPEPTLMNATVGDSSRSECCLLQCWPLNVGPSAEAHSVALNGVETSVYLRRNRVNQRAHPPPSALAPVSDGIRRLPAPKIKEVGHEVQIEQVRPPQIRWV